MSGLWRWETRIAIGLVKSQNKFLRMDFVFANQNILEILEISLEHGNSKKLLLQPGNIGNSPNPRRKYFPHGMHWVRPYVFG